MPRIELFISNRCLSFRPAMELFETLREAFPDEEYEIVDCLEDRDRARKAGVVMDPAFVVDGQVVAVGLPGRDELLRKTKSSLKK